MESKKYAHDRLHSAIVKTLDESGLTIAGLGMLWSAEIDEAPRNCEQRVRRLRKRLPKQMVDLVSLLDAIGCKLTLEKK